MSKLNNIQIIQRAFKELNKPPRMDLDYAIKSNLKDDLTKSYLCYYFVNATFDIKWYKALFNSEFFNFNILFNSENKLSVNTKLWFLRNIINKASDYNIQNKTEELTEILISTLENYLKYINSNNIKENESEFNEIFVRLIIKLPLQKISESHFEFVRNHIKAGNVFLVNYEIVNSYFKRAIENQDKLNITRLLNLFFEIKNKKEEIAISLSGYFSDSEMNEVLGYSNKIAEILGIKAIEIIEEKIFSYYNAYPYQFSRGTIPTINDDLSYSFAHGLNYFLIAMLRSLLLEGDAKIAIRALNTYLIESNLEILKRLSFYTINKRYDELAFKDIFWNLENPLNIDGSSAEVYKLIESQIIHFSKAQLESFIDWVLNVESTDGEDINYKEQTQLNWLSLTQKIENSALIKIKLMFNFQTELLEKLDSLKDIRPFESGYFTENSFAKYPLEEERIYNKKIQQIINDLNQSAIPFGYDNYGFHQDIVTTFKTRLIELEPYYPKIIGIEFERITSIFQALNNLIETEKVIDWSCSINFTSALVKHYLNNEKVDKNKLKHLWSTICWFLGDLCKKNQELELDSLDEAIMLLLNIANNYTTDKEEDISNDLGSAINSVEGKLYEVLINLSLKKFEKDNTTWDLKVKDLFNHKLASNSSGKYFFMILGIYIPAISYLDFNWIETKKDSIFLNEKDPNFNTFRVYVCYSRSFFKNLVSEIKDIYLQMIENINDESAATDKLIEHILISKFNIKDQTYGFYEKLFEIANPNQILSLVNYLSNKNNLMLTNADIISVWNSVINIMENYAIETKDKVYFKLPFLIGNIDLIDKVFLDLTKVSIQNSSKADINLIRVLKDKINGNEETVGMILNELIKKNGEISFYQEDVKQLVIDVYKKGFIELGDEIVENGLGKELFFLLDVYIKYSTTNSN